MLKKFNFLTVILLSLFIMSSFQKSMADEKDEAAIKKVIENETKFAFDANYEEFAKTWVHEPYALWTSAGNYNHNEFLGWDSIGINLKRWMESWTEPFADEVIRKNFSYRIYGNGAWVTYEQYNKSSMEKNPDLLPSRQLRILEKTDDGWKIAFVGVIDRNSYKLNNAEQDLNNAGYTLLGQDKVKEAIEVFKTNVKLYPESSNVYDSLGEAYMKDGNKELAIKNYEKSLKLDPKNDNAKKMLEELKK
jgi:tetratricopeptide (TPR) repeat protein